MSTLSNAHYGDDLSDREFQILSEVAKGFSNKEISARLFLSMHTVKTYLQSTFRKLGVDNRVTCVVVAIHKGILPCPCPTHVKAPTKHLFPDLY